MRLLSLRPYYCILKFQSTHPRGVRLKRDAKIWEDFLISIHAPTWGATSVCLTALRRSFNFNPRTHVGCDTVPTATIGVNINFNPRTHVGCDRNTIRFFNIMVISIHAPTWGATQIEGLLNALRDISIHAPTWGATGRGRPVLQPVRISIHAPTWGATQVITSSRRYLVFQSTHPRGVRPKSLNLAYIRL